MVPVSKTALPEWMMREYEINSSWGSCTIRLVSTLQNLNVKIKCEELFQIKGVKEA